MEHQTSFDLNPPSSSLSIGAISKTLIMIKRNKGRAQDLLESSRVPLENFDLTKKADLHLFLFLLKKANKTKQEESIITKTFSDFSFFKKMDPKVSSLLLQGFSQYFEYISRTGGSTIYENGEEGDYLYIILSGTVYVLISKSGLMPGNESPKSPKKTNSPTNLNKFSLDEDEKESPKNRPSMPRRGSFFFKSSGFEMMNQEMERRSPLKKQENYLQRMLKYISIKYPEHYIANELTSGDSFGEVALIMNSPRNETTICKETCNFLRIDKKNYKKILMMNHSRELRDLVDFFSKFDIFSHWPRAQLSTFLKFFKMNEFNNNDVLYKENDESTFLYFIKKGEVEISKLVHCDGIKKEESIHGNISNQSIFDIKKYQMYNTYWQDSFQKKSVKRAKLAILGPGCYFGEEEFLANTLRVTKAVVKMKSVIYIIKNEIFSTNVKTKTTLDKISDEYKMKEHWRRKLVRKGIKEEKILVDNKAKSLHSAEESLSRIDFQGRVPFESRLFVKAKHQVIKKRKEMQLRNLQISERNQQIAISKPKTNNSEHEKQKPKFKLDLSDLLKHDNLISSNKNPVSLPTDVKRGNARVSYLFKEDELTSKERQYTNTSRRGINDKSIDNDGKSGVVRNMIKGKFEKALEKIKLRKESQHTNGSARSQETESNQTKGKLQKFIQMMFKGNKTSTIKNLENKTQQQNIEKTKTVSKRGFKENLSQIYLYNDSFQNKNETMGEEAFYTERERCVNIHVEKMKKKNKNNGSFRALLLFKREKIKEGSVHHDA